MPDPLDVVLIGPFNIDIIINGKAPLEPEKLTNWFGLSRVSLNAAGSAGYVIMDLQRLGVRCGAISTIAWDATGAFLLRALQDAGVDTSHVRVQPDTTSAIGIYILLFGSKKRPLTGAVGTHMPWPESFNSTDLEYISKARLLHFGGYLHYPKASGSHIVQAYRLARSQGVITSMDPQFPLEPVEPPWMPWLEGVIEFVDVFLCDEDEARHITAVDDLDAAAQRLLDAGPRTLVIKRGHQGALVFTADGQRIEQPPYVVPEDDIADTIGAGDAFDAGFLLGVLEGWPLARTAQFASTVAALSLRGPGGTETFPDRITAEVARAAYFDR